MNDIEKQELKKALEVIAKWEKWLKVNEEILSKKFYRLNHAKITGEFEGQVTLEWDSYTLGSNDHESQEIPYEVLGMTPEELKNWVNKKGN